MKKITVQSLLNDDSELISESTFKSIKKNGRMLTKVRQSIETQLKCQFEIVIYKSGRKGKPSYFLVDKKKINSDKYKAHGRKPVILQEDLNAILNFIGKQEPTKMVGRGKKEVENSFTAKEIFQRSFNIGDIDYAVRNCYVENYYELEALKLVDEHLDTEIRQQIDCNTLINIFGGWFKSLAKQYVEKTLSNYSLVYSMSYYSFSDFTYDEEKGEKIKKPNFNKISEVEFNDFKIERIKYRDSLSNDLTNKEKDKYVKEEMENIFNYSQVFEKYVFHDNYDLINNDFDVLECNQRLEKRLIRLAIENQNRYEVDGEPSPVEYATYRLKKFGEYALFCEKLYNKIFKLNGHNDTKERFYDSNSAIKNNINRMIKEYHKNNMKYQEKEETIKKVHLSETHKQIFDNNQINDIFIQKNLELFARIVEKHYEHTVESYEAFKETSCEKIKELGKQKNANLPKEVLKELEIRYSENQKEPTWLELLENEILDSENNKTQYTENINNYDSENTSKISYDIYYSKKNVEDKRKEIK